MTVKPKKSTYKQKTEVEKAQIVEQVLGQELKASDVAMQYNISQKQVYRIVGHYKKTKSIARKEGTGSQSKLTPNDIRILKREVSKNQFSSWKQIAYNFNKGTNKSISSTTARRAAQKLGIELKILRLEPKQKPQQILQKIIPGLEAKEKPPTRSWNRNRQQKEDVQTVDLLQSQTIKQDT